MIDDRMILILSAMLTLTYCYIVSYIVILLHCNREVFILLRLHCYVDIVIVKNCYFFVKVFESLDQIFWKKCDCLVTIWEKIYD
jgi:hypothetical protein